MYEYYKSRSSQPARQVRPPEQQEQQSNAAVGEQVVAAEESATPLLDGVAQQDASRLPELRASAEAGEDGAQEAYLAALSEESADFAAGLATLPPEEVSAFLREGGADTAREMLNAALDTGDRTTMRAVVGALMRGGEALSREDVAQLGEILAEADQGPNSLALRQVVAEGIREGNGALLAMSMADSLSGTDQDGMVYGINGAIFDVQAEFRESSAEATRLRQDMLAAEAVLVADGVATEEEIEQWRTRTLAENSEVFAAQEASAAVFASTLEGQSYAQDELRPNHQTDSLNQSGMELLGDLASTGAGANAAAEALLRSGRGQGSWIENARSGMGEEQAAQLDRLVEQGASQGVGALAAMGDLETMQVFLSGLGNAVGEEQAPAIERMRERIAALSAEEIDPAELPRALAGAIRGDGENPEIAEHLVDRMALGAFLGGNVSLASGAAVGGKVSGTVGNLVDARRGRSTPGGRGFGAMGAALSLFSNGVAAFDDGDWDDIAKMGMDAVELGAHGAALMGSPGLLRMVSRAALPVSAVFSTLDVLSNLADGNFEGAAVASLPLAGMAIGAFFGPGGAAIGLGVGAIVSGIMSMMGVGAGDKVQGIATQALMEILTERGISPGAAQQLADELATPGAAERLRFIAADLGYTDQAMLEALGAADPDYVYFFFQKLNRGLTFEDDEQGGRRRFVHHDLSGDPYLSHLEIIDQLRPENAGEEGWDQQLELLLEAQTAKRYD